MKKIICVTLAVLIMLCVSVCAADTSDALTETAAETEETTVEEVTDPVPETEETTAEEVTDPASETEEDDGRETALTLIKINIYMFIGGVALLIVCTVIFFVMKAKNKKANTENND